MEEAATFSLRCSKLAVPGIGSVTYLLDSLNSRDRPSSDRKVGNEADAVLLTGLDDILVVAVY